MRNLVLLSLWMTVTIIMVFSIIGMFLFISDIYDQRSTWMEMGYKLQEKVTRENSVCAFIVWLLYTLVLIGTIIGMLLFTTYGGSTSTWLSIGRELSNKSTKD